MNILKPHVSLNVANIDASVTFIREGLRREACEAPPRLRQVRPVGAERSALTGRALTEARNIGLETVYLLTNTAESFFPRFGFEPIAWAAVPPRVQESREFHGACPSSAVAMRATVQGIVEERVQ
jgi:hypothetical protein